MKFAFDGNVCIVHFFFFLAVETGRPRVAFNVNGHLFETFKETLLQHPNTLLGNIKKLFKYYDKQQEVYFFNRTHTAFEAVLFYYQSNGCLLKPSCLPMSIFVEECLFYELDHDVIRAMIQRENQTVPSKLLKENINNKLNCLWSFLEYPKSSVFAQVFTYISLFCIFMTVVIDCYETIPRDKNENKLIHDDSNLKLVQFSLNLFFAMEFLMRFFSCPSKLKFIFSFSNIVDISVIFPSLIIYFTNNWLFNGSFFARVLRVFRIFRLTRLSKSFQALRVSISIVSQNLSYLLAVSLSMLLSVIFFSSIVYYAESDIPKSKFVSMPESMWFVLTTIVPIGYGDIIPETMLGKITATATAVFGTLIVTVPLLSFGGKCYLMYANALKLDFGDLLSRPTVTAVKKAQNVKTKLFERN